MDSHDDIDHLIHEPSHDPVGAALEPDPASRPPQMFSAWIADVMGIELGSD